MDRTGKPASIRIIHPDSASRSWEPRHPDYRNLFAHSDSMRAIRRIIEEIADSSATVLVRGESGVGKDLIARAIPGASRRAEQPFVKVNCAALPSELLESELFGHEKGAFTGAYQRKQGKFEFAQHGTLFLDEIGELPLPLQAKLLHVLQDREFFRIGGRELIQADTRIIASTNRDLQAALRLGQFREDLFYRLNVVEIHVPPLRDRREEIPHLSTVFVREACERLGKGGVRLSPDTLDLFDAYSWPGNVRQLRNEVQRAVAMAAPGGVITPDLLSPVFAGTEEAPQPRRARNVTLPAAVERLEREMIEGVLERTSGNVSQSARALGLTRRGLYLKMDRLGIEYKVSTA